MDEARVKSRSDSSSNPPCSDDSSMRRSLVRGSVWDKLIDSRRTDGSNDYIRGWWQHKTRADGENLAKRRFTTHSAHRPYPPTTSRGWEVREDKCPVGVWDRAEPISTWAVCCRYGVL